MSEVNMEKLKHDVIEVAKKLAGDKLYCVYLYGSYARGDYDDESDVDIMLIVDWERDTISKSRKRMCRYASLLGLEFEKEISILIRDKKTFYEMEDTLPFYHNVIQEGVVWYER